jgi:glycosyltransferase involved in cell wall biosynthesis
VPVSVLHLITGLGVGGAETLLLDLVRSMPEREFHHRVVALVGGGALQQRFQAAGIPVHDLGVARGWPDPRALPRLRALLRAERPEILQGWMYHANLLGTLAARALRPAPRVIWGLHAAALDFSRYNPLTRVTTSLCARLSRWPAAVVANSEATRDYHVALGYHPAEWTVIYNGVDVRRFAPDPAARGSVRTELGIPDNAPLVGMFARWDPMKDHASFLHAAATLAAGHPLMHVVLAGQGVTADNAELAELTRTAGALHGRLHVLGVRSDMPRLNAALDVAAVTSVSGESFSLACAEAMASAVPCVVTDLTFLPSLVGDTGIVVPRGRPDAVATGIERLLALGETERRALGARARDRIVARFSLEAMVRQYDALYRGLSRERLAS